MVLLHIGGKGIPNSAEEKGSACFSEGSKRFASSIFSIILEIILASKKSVYMLKLWKNLMSIPLLTWKLSEDSIQKLVGGSESFFLSGLSLFIRTHLTDLNHGALSSCLPADNLFDIPVSSTILFLANLVQLGMVREISFANICKHYYH